MQAKMIILVNFRTNLDVHVHGLDKKHWGGEPGQRVLVHDSCLPEMWWVERWMTTWGCCSSCEAFWRRRRRWRWMLRRSVLPAVSLTSRCVHHTTHTHTHTHTHWATVDDRLHPQLCTIHNQCFIVGQQNMVGISAAVRVVFHWRLGTQMTHHRTHCAKTWRHPQNWKYITSLCRHRRTAPRLCATCTKNLVRSLVSELLVTELLYFWVTRVDKVKEI